MNTLAHQYRDQQHARTLLPKGHPDRLVDAAGIVDDWDAIVSASEAVAATSSVTGHEIGEISPLKAAHLRTVDRPFDSEAVDPAQRQENGYSALTTASVKRTRGKKGTSTRVIRHGRSLVIGDSYPVDTTASRVPAMVIEHAIEQARTTEHGVDGIALARIATLAYDLPDLIGGEFQSWSEVIPDSVGNLIDWNVAGHTTGAWIKGGETTMAWPTRYRMPAVRMRKGEQGATLVTFNDGQSVARLISPSATPDRAFRGHRAYVRPASRGNRAERAARARQYDSVLLTADPLLDLKYLAEHAGKGERIAWTTADRSLSGTLSRSPGGKLNAVCGDVKVRSARTSSALVTALAPLFV